jgi:hypothetical protein
VTLDFQPFDPTFVLSLLQSMYCGGSRLVSSPAHVFDDVRIGEPTHGMWSARKERRRTLLNLV